MPNNHSTLTALFTDIANAIRSKAGTTDPIKADAFPSAIRAIETTGGGGAGAAGDYRAMIGMVEGTLSGAYTNYSAKTVTPYALRFCQQAETLAFPEASTISPGAFYDLNGLKSVNLNRVRNLDYQCFRSCNNLETVNIENCLSLNSEVFANCAKLKSVTIDSLEYIGSSAFQSCKALQTLNGPSVKGIWICGLSGAGFSHVSFPLLQYIGARAFAYCTNLLEIELPTAIILRELCFSNCTNLSYVKMDMYTGRDPAVFPFPSLIGNQGNQGSIFENCTGLKEAHFPEMLEIRAEFFRSCYKLEYVNAPKVEFMSDGFNYCSSLKEINFPVCSVIGYDCFWQCYSLSKAIIPNCTHISLHGFVSCALASLSLPKLINLSSLAFSGCSKLSAIYLLGSSVATLQNVNAFQQTPITVLDYLGYYGSIYVPGDLVSVYQSATNWSLVSSRITAYLGS